MPVPAFDQRLNKLFELGDAIEIACQGNNRRVMNDKLAEALGLSCLLLRDINGDSTIMSAEIDAGTWRILDSMRRTGRLTQFLEIERQLLSMTKLESSVVNYIIARLEATLRAVIDSQGNLPGDWRNVLVLMAGRVCEQVPKSAGVNERQTLLRRAFLGASGGFISLLNLVPPIDLPQPIRTLSTGAGLWLIDRAAGGFFDGWTDH
jgi:hypothetical protein